MDLSLPPRLPAQLENAIQRVRMAVRSAAEHTVDSLGLAAAASTQVLQRDALLGAQFELNRKLAIFTLTFNDALDSDVARQAGVAGKAPTTTVTPDSLVANWESMTLVDNQEVELHLSADRFALEITHACEWEIRELDGYMATLLHLHAADPASNPLRAEVIGQAMIRAIEALADRPDVRKVLVTEIGRSLARAMRQTYSDIVADLRHAGLRPVGMTLRATVNRSPTLSGGLGTAAAAASSPQGAPSHPGMPSQHGPADDAGGFASHAGRPGAWQAAGRSPAQLGAASTRSGGFAPSERSGLAPSLGQVDVALMSLIRQLARQPAGFDAATPAGGPVSDDVDDSGAADSDLADWPPRLGARGDAAGHTENLPLPAQGRGLQAPNLIVAHRDALRQTATSALDHRVIDVIGGLFDEILSDSKLAPQMTRQIARLQLPVLRAALGDSSFFSSRRHPVRQFVNRIASLGSAIDDFETAAGRQLLARVAELVQEVVAGEFDRIEVYQQKLRALEQFAVEQAQAELSALGSADEVLARKEHQLQSRQRSAQVLQTALQSLPLPDYLRDFLAGEWSQVIASALAEQDEALAQRLRQAGHDLVLSVQPKAAPEHRKQFLRHLPQLMKTLSLGLDRIACPEDTRRQFFARLLPAHAESLKLTGQPPGQLAQNLLIKQVDAALATPMPAEDVLPLHSPATPQAAQALQALATTDAFTPAEAQAVGLLVDAAVDWDGALDIDLSVEPDLTAADLSIAGLPMSEAAEPSRGKSLADHVQIGLAYQMQLQGQWQKVRLAHVSPARSFFVFTHGAKQRETVSMTHRMLVKLCAAGRLRALESAYLLERATARARRQLAAIPLDRH